jgi:hypothetical protein
MALMGSVVSGIGTRHRIRKLSGGGSFSYTPNTDYLGTDSFYYRACDSVGSSTAAVRLIIDALRRPRCRSTIVKNALYKQTLTEPSSTLLGMLAKDKSVGNSPLTAVLVSGSGLTHSTLALNANGGLM